MGPSSFGEVYKGVDGRTSQVFQRVRHEESEAEVDEEVDVLMSSDIVSAQHSMIVVAYVLFQERIGDYNVNFYLVEGMRRVSRKRREHLTADDIKKNNSFMQSLASGAAVGDEDFKAMFLVTEMLRKLKAQSRMGMTSRKAHLIKMLGDIGDFYLELKWDFQSWIPLLSRMLPSDVCKIYKKCTQLRMDTTLADFNERRWERGDISFVFNAKAKYESDELIIMDNNAKVFQRVRHEESEAEVDEEVDVLMSSDIVSAQVGLEEAVSVQGNDEMITLAPCELELEPAPEEDVEMMEDSETVDDAASTEDDQVLYCSISLLQFL
ncbi:frog antimicrobial peptide [Ostertagia ostertagi]